MVYRLLARHGWRKVAPDTRFEKRIPPLADALPSAYPSQMASELTPEYVAMLRRMSGVEKVRAAFALYWTARQVKSAGLRHQHPDWTEEQVQRRVKEIFLHAVT